MGVAALPRRPRRWSRDRCSPASNGRGGPATDGHLSFLLSLLALAEIAVDPEPALAHVEEAVAVARACPATSALVYPLCQLSVVSGRPARDPDRALAAAEECIRLDRSHRKVWSTLSEFAAARLRVDRGEVASRTPALERRPPPARLVRRGRLPHDAAPGSGRRDRRPRSDVRGSNSPRSQTAVSSRPSRCSTCSRASNDSRS